MSISFGNMAVQGTLPSITFIGENIDTPTQTTYTFSSATLGTPFPDRVILISAHGATGSGGLVSSVTVAGNSATELIQAPASQEPAGIYAIRDRTNSTGDIVVTFNQASTRVCAAVHNLLAIDSLTPTDTISVSEAEPASEPIDVVANGIIIAATSRDSGGSVTWTGVTETYDNNPEGNSVFSGGTHTATTAQTARTISPNYTGGVGNSKLSAVALR